LFNHLWVTEEIREEIKFPGSLWKWKYHLPKLMGHSKGSPKRKVYIHKCKY
jgi:hypothetical protein